MRFQTTVLAWAFNIEKINESSLEIIGALCPGTRRIIIPGHQSSTLKTVSSSLSAEPGMTRQRPLGQAWSAPWPGTRRSLLPLLVKCHERWETFSSQRVRVSSCVNMKHSLGRQIVIHEPQISRGFTRIWTLNREFTYSELTSFSPCVAS